MPYLCGQFIILLMQKFLAVICSSLGTMGSKPKLSLDLRALNRHTLTWLTIQTNLIKDPILSTVLQSPGQADGHDLSLSCLRVSNQKAGFQGAPTLLTQNIQVQPELPKLEWKTQDHKFSAMIVAQTMFFFGCQTLQCLLEGRIPAGLRGNLVPSPSMSVVQLCNHKHVASPFWASVLRPLKWKV